MPESLTPLPENFDSALSASAESDPFALGEGDTTPMFDDLVVGGADTLRDLKESLSKADFGQLDVNNFKDFQATDVVPTTGEFRFSVEQKWLREGTSVMRLISSVSARGQASYGGMKITLYKKKIRLSTFNQSAFAEIYIPVFEGLDTQDQEVSFIFDQAVLAKIANSFGDAIIEFSFFAEQSLLQIKSQNTKLELSTFNPEDFVDYHSKLSEPKPILKLNPVAFKAALKFSSQFAKRDEIAANLSLVDARDDSVLSGSHAAIGMFQHNDLKGLQVKVKHEVISVLEKLLARFNEATTHLFDVGDYYMIRDENLYFGFEKSQYDFPPMEAIMGVKMVESVLVQRNDLIGSLNRLSVVSVDREMMLRLEVTGIGNDCQFSLETQDSRGRSSTDKIPASRKPLEGTEISSMGKQVIYVSLHTLLKVASHFETANVNIKFEEKGQALFVEDTDDLSFVAKTALVAMSEATYKQMQTEKSASALDKAKAAGKKSARRDKTEKTEEEAEAV